MPFDEILFDSDLLTAGSATGGPEYANTIIKNPATGIYKVNVNRYDPQQVWNLDITLLNAADLEYFNRFWQGGYGSGYGFRLRIISDFYVEDQVLGTGNGVQTIFPLIKTYLRPGASHSYSKRIIKPVVVPNPLGASVTLYEADGTTARIIPSALGLALTIPAFTIMLNGTPTTAYVVNNQTGVVTMNSAPAGGVVVTWSGEFDYPVRFMNNSLALKPDVSSDVSGIQICEILPAELGVS